MELTTEVVRELLDYNQLTGVFTWKVRAREWFKSEQGFKVFHTRYAGEVAGYVWTNTRGYQNMRLNLFGKLYGLHRLAFLYLGEELPEQVDHLNRDATDNRWSNLVASSAKDNNKNASMSRNNKSGVTGVYWNKEKGKWKAQVRFDNRGKCLGYFTDLEEAAEAVRRFRLEKGFSDGHGMAHAQYMTR